MLSEEEKKARDILVNEIADILVGEYCKKCKICENEDTECYYGKAIDTIDDLIKKQQKEIEGLKIIHNKHKDKIKWKTIKKYDRKKYDWVLIRYFDKDFECIPEVAEQRADGKWYTSEREIPSQFEVKYFYDINELLKDE